MTVSKEVLLWINWYLNKWQAHIQCKATTVCPILPYHPKKNVLNLLFCCVFREDFNQGRKQVISPTRTPDFVFAHWHFVESMVNYYSLLCALMLQEVDSMNGYMTTKEAAEKWGITQRQVQNHCKMNRIPGVLTHGTTYMIPENAERPVYGFFSGQPSSEKGNTEK